MVNADRHTGIVGVLLYKDKRTLFLYNKISYNKGAEYEKNNFTNTTIYNYPC
jgi:hypothetical protein